MAVPKKTVFILKGYPRLSETFIAQEILALERMGLPLVIASLRHPTDRLSHPLHKEISAPVLYLPEYVHQAPLRIFRSWRWARRQAGYRAAWRMWLSDLGRDISFHRLRRFAQALVLAHELPGDVGHFHAHFLHGAASVARYGARIRGLDWSCSAHAVDIWTTPEWEKREKLEDCAWMVTCTATNHDHLKSLAPHPGCVELVYHGLDLERFAPGGETATTPASPRRDGTDDSDPVVILSVGRAVEKKGFDILLAALAKLPATLNWRLHHIGGGALLGQLQRQAGRLGIAPRIHWHGPQAQQTVLDHYRAADLFVLASRIAANGDRDGLPNVLMEAQSQGLACISTRVSAIPELITDGVTGVLSPPDDPDALAAAIAAAIGDPERRGKLGAAGQQRVRQDFALADNIENLAIRFGVPVPSINHPEAKTCESHSMPL